MLIKYGYTQENFIDILPYLLIQVNTVFVWVCTGTYWIWNIHETPNNYNDQLMSSLLGYAIYLSGMNSFLYTWHFIEAIERDQSCAETKFKTIKLLRVASIVLVPLVYICVFIVLIVYEAKYHWVIS